MYIVIIHFIVEKICQTLTAKITHIIFEYFFTHLFLFPNYYQSYVSFRIKKKMRRKASSDSIHYFIKALNFVNIVLFIILT